METWYKKTYGKDADLSHLKSIGARAFVRIKNPNKLGHTSWEGMVCGFSETDSNSYRIWNSETASRGGGKERRFQRTTTKSAFRAQAALAATRSRVTVVRFQRRHARQQLRLARRYPGGRAELHLRSDVWRRHACWNGRIASSV